MRFAALALLAVLPAFSPAIAQDIPESMRGTYAAPSCAAATAAVHITSRSVVEMPRDGEQRLTRIARLGSAGDWTMLVATGADARRIMLRAAGTDVDVLVPDAKIRDDQLPGLATETRYERCTEAPTIVTLHAEGLAFLHALEAMEPVCGRNLGNANACLQAFFEYADISKDGKLSPAEIARALRGATWAIQMTEGADGTTLAAGYAGSALLGIAAAQVVVQAYDYDLSGSLSIAELTQDRMPVPLMPPARTASVAPVPLDSLATQLGGLKEVLDQLPALLR